MAGVNDVKFKIHADIINLVGRSISEDLQCWELVRGLEVRWLKPLLREMTDRGSKVEDIYTDE